MLETGLGHRCISAPVPSVCLGLRRYLVGRPPLRKRSAHGRVSATRLAVGRALDTSFGAPNAGNTDRADIYLVGTRKPTAWHIAAPVFAA